jgi:CheY-like chemotaxis protein
MHDAQIEIRSPGIGQGTDVEIRLPTIAPQAAAVAAAAVRPAPVSRRLRVLIVEDNVDAAEMMELVVSQSGHVTRVAHDGASAVASATEFLPDVILLDIGLPVMNGYDVARSVRALPQCRHIHIAAVTGWGQEEDQRKAQEAGCDSHLTKPLSPATLDELLARISEL